MASMSAPRSRISTVRCADRMGELTRGHLPGIVGHGLERSGDPAPQDDRTAMMPPTRRTSPTRRAMTSFLVAVLRLLPSCCGLQSADGSVS